MIRLSQYWEDKEARTLLLFQFLNDPIKPIKQVAENQAKSYFNF